MVTPSSAGKCSGATVTVLTNSHYRVYVREADDTPWLLAGYCMTVGGALDDPTYLSDEYSASVIVFWDSKLRRLQNWAIIRRGDKSFHSAPFPYDHDHISDAVTEMVFGPTGVIPNG